MMICVSKASSFCLILRHVKNDNIRSAMTCRAVFCHKLLSTIQSPSSLEFVAHYTISTRAMRNHFIMYVCKAAYAHIMVLTLQKILRKNTE